VTPGKVSFVNCGKSSSVRVPYFFFIASAAGFSRAPARRLKRLRIG
jgi:hypothetical protein